MAIGHNTNTVFDGITYHVQTEKLGVENPIIDTTVYFKGRVVHQRKNSYEDLLPLTPERNAILQQRAAAQHQAIVEEIRSGVLRLGVPPPKPAAAPAEPQELHVKLLNPRGWVAGGRASLQVLVSIKPAQTAVAGARIVAQIEGAAAPAEFGTETGPDGRATLEFPMPRLGSGEAALVLRAEHGDRRAQLRFQLRAKPKTPAAS